MNLILQHFVIKHLISISVLDQSNIWDRIRYCTGNEKRNNGQVLYSKQSTARINNIAQSHDQREEKKLNSTIIISNGAHTLKADKIIKNQ